MRSPLTPWSSDARSCGAGASNRRRVHRVVAGEALEQQRCVRDGRSERPDLVERARERDQPVTRGRAHRSASCRRLPQSDAGWRIEPPVSDPSASGTNPAATAAADPPDDPPGTLPVFHGFLVGPNAEFSVDEPIANSSRFVFPTAYGSGFAQPLHDGRVVGRTPSLEDPGSRTSSRDCGCRGCPSARSARQRVDQGPRRERPPRPRRRPGRTRLPRRARGSSGAQRRPPRSRRRTPAPLHERCARRCALRRQARGLSWRLSEDARHLETSILLGGAQPRARRRAQEHGTTTSSRSTFAQIERVRRRMTPVVSRRCRDVTCPSTDESWSRRARSPRRSVRGERARPRRPRRHGREVRSCQGSDPLDERNRVGLDQLAVVVECGRHESCHRERPVRPVPATSWATRSPDSVARRGRHGSRTRAQDRPRFPGVERVARGPRTTTASGAIGVSS